jgi:hypothetical protein
VPPTLDEIRRAGLAALRQRLGRAGMIRFLQQFETGSGDYARERHAWVDGMTLPDLKALTVKSTKRRRAAQ